MKDKLKNTLEHEVELLGRSISVLAIAGLLVVGGASAALLNQFGTITGDADIDQALEVNGQTGEFDGSFSYSGEVGNYFVAEVESEEYVTVETNLQDGTTAEIASEYAYDSGDLGNQRDGLTAHFIDYEVRDEDDFDAVVDGDGNAEDSPYETIQDAIDEGEEEILVESGEYEGFDPDGDLTLVSAEGPTETTINVEDDRVEWNEDEVVVRGFTFTGEGDGETLLLHTEAGNVEGTFTVEDNIFDTEADFRAVWSQNVDEATFIGNFFTGEADTGVELNADNDDNEEVTATFEENTFANLDDAGIGFRAEEDSTDELIVNDNNFLSMPEGIQQQDDADVTGTGNYFDQVTEEFAGSSEDGLSDESSVPRTTGAFDVGSEDEVRVVQVNYLDIALSTGNHDFRTTIDLAE